MSSPGYTYGNAAIETFFDTLKSECLYRAHYTLHTEVEELIAQYFTSTALSASNLNNGLTPYEIRSKAA